MYGSRIIILVQITRTVAEAHVETVVVSLDVENSDLLVAKQSENFHVLLPFLRSLLTSLVPALVVGKVAGQDDGRGVDGRQCVAGERICPKTGR